MKKLDREFEEVKLYCVDGKRGTLKELSDYFNADPIKVSDLLLEGTSLEDALLQAARPVEVIPTNEIKSVAKQKETKTSEKPKTLEEPIKCTDKSEKGFNEKPLSAPNPIIKPEFGSLGEVVSSSSSVPTVQDCGDFIIVTTTTTTVIKRR